MCWPQRIIFGGLKVGFVVKCKMFFPDNNLIVILLELWTDKLRSKIKIRKYQAYH